MGSMVRRVPPTRAVLETVNANRLLAQIRRGIADERVSRRPATRTDGQGKRDIRKPGAGPNVWAEYEFRKSAWLARNPEASPEEITRAMTRIAAELGL